MKDEDGKRKKNLLIKDKVPHFIPHPFRPHPLLFMLYPFFLISDPSSFVPFSW